LPRRLTTLATKAGKPCLNLTLTVKSSKVISAAQAGTDAPRRPGLPASGMFVINPPHTLKSLMTSALPSMVALLGQDRNAAFTAE
jgi:23S rRNA (adenine2030-N6)-methyltransferase